MASFLFIRSKTFLSFISRANVRTSLLLFIHGIYGNDHRETAIQQIVYFDLSGCPSCLKKRMIRTNDVNVSVSQSICVSLWVPGGHGTP